MARARALRSARERCPDFAVALQNFYGHESELFLGDRGVILSREGTTQGCPFGMGMFAVSSLSLISRVETEGTVQVWSADDSAGAGSVRAVKSWFDALKREGPEFGYEVKLSKTVAIVKPEAVAQFERTFKGMTDQGNGGLRVMCSGIGVLDEVDGPEAARLLGHRYLGAGVGSGGFRKEFVEMKVKGWVEDIRKLSVFGKAYPHQAYSLLVRCLIPRWRYLMRTVEVPRDIFGPLERALIDRFFPSVFGWTPIDHGFRRRVGLPARHGGLGIPEVADLAGEEWASSALLTGVLTEAILRQDGGYVEDLRASRARRAERQRARDTGCQLVADEVEGELSGRAWRGFHEGRMRGGSAWLSVIPMESLNLDLDGLTFRDAVALRMGVEFPDPLPDSCASCGEPFSLAHALKCKRGGWWSVATRRSSGHGCPICGRAGSRTPLRNLKSPP